MKTTPRRGFTITETLASVACGAVLLSLCAFASPRAQDGRDGKSMKDMTQLRDLVTAMIIFAESNDGHYARPGLINRKGDTPGVGDEDPSLNTTANLYSALIVQRYIATDAVISPVDRNPRVKDDSNYDFDQYNPANDVYWDNSFTADLELGSNTSYAHLPMFGKRMTQKWRTTMKADECVFGNRGPKDGRPNSTSYTTDPHGFWSGNVAFNDSHVEFFRDFAPKFLAREGEGNEVGKADNLFAFDEGPDGGDIVLTFTKAMGEDGPAVQFD